MKRVVAVNLVLVGMLLCIVFAWACSPGSGLSPPDAHAQSACRQWEVQRMRIPRTESTAIPAGWEPFAASTEYDAQLWVVYRSCSSR